MDRAGLQVDQAGLHVDRAGRYVDQGGRYVDRASLHASPRAPSFTKTSLFLKQDTDRWDANGNHIVQVTRDMADKIYHMAQYLRRKGPIPVRYRSKTFYTNKISW